MKHGCKRIAVLLTVLLLAWGCETVRYRTYGFEWTSTSSPQDLEVDVVTTGTSMVQDSSGTLVERSASPYRVGIYLSRPSLVDVKVLEVRFVGERSGAVIAPATWSPADLGDGSHTVVFVAPAVQLPFEEYRVEMRIRIGEGASTQDVYVSGRLKTRFEQSKALRFWEELMSV
jgi:hypothetical protein